MKQNDFYEVNGCTDFIPVKLIEKHKHLMNALELEVAESGFRTFAPAIYKFPKIDEPQKVTVPKFVAEWLEENDWRKDTLGRQTIFDAFDNLTLDASNGLYVDVKKWVEENGNIFLQAWVFGYEVEKEKLYTARLKLLSFKKYSYINKNKDKKTLCLSDSDDLTNVYQTHFTQAELEGLGVWDNPAFEIEEVEA